MHTRPLALFCLFVLATPANAQQPPQEKATEALTVRHIPHPSAGRLWQRPDKWIRYQWPYRIEVKNNLDVPLQITHFGFYCQKNGKWVLENVTGSLYTTAEFSNRYDDGDSIKEGWIPPGKVAVDADNWNTWWPPAPPPCKWAYTAKDPVGNLYQAEGEPALTPVLYRYHAGDDTAWAKPEFDDSGWEKIKPWDFPAERWQGVGWFRYALQVDSSLWHQPLGLHIFNIFGAVEFYLDGKLIHRVGRIVASKEEEEALIMWNSAPISFEPPAGHVGGSSPHLIAIRYSSFFWDSPIWSGQRWTFGWDLGDMQRMSANRANRVRKVTFHQMFLTGIFLAFALLHLLLFLFYPRLRANLYFAALTTCFALLVYFWFQLWFIAEAVHFVWHVRWRNAAMTLMLFSALRLTYLLLYARLPKIFIPFLLVGVGLTLWNWLRPFIVTDTYLVIFYIAVIAEMARVLIAVRSRKRETQFEGSWIILLGMIPFALVGTYYLLNVLEVAPIPWEFEDFPAPFYAMLILMISMSVFLARNFAQTNKNLEAQLIQVKALSEKAVLQERERARLEAEHARKTQELEEARQLQLAMLPKTVPQLPHLEIAVHSKPATEVGGDYYDFHLDGEGSLTIAIGDATGHGMKAGTVVSVSKGLFKSLAHEDSLPHILQKMSRALDSMNLGYLYMAMMLVKYHENKITISTAGMPPALRYNAAANHVDEILLKGLPLGGFPDFQYEKAEVECGPGDTLVLMSDGLPEMFNQAGEILDYPAMKKLVEEVTHASPQAIIDYLVTAGEKWAGGRAQEDDVTFVVVKVKT